MKMLSIRPYDDAADRPALERMMEGLQDHLVRVDSLQRTLREDGYGASYAERTVEKVRANDGVIFLADLDGAPVGCVAGTIREQRGTDRLECVPSKDGIVEELYVDPTVRGGGVGLQLMEHIEAFFRERRCTVVRLDVFADNQLARDFYEHLGYRNRMLSLLKQL